MIVARPSAPLPPPPPLPCGPVAGVMNDQDSPPLLPRRRRRCLTSAGILSDTPLPVDLRSSQATRDEMARRRASPIDVDDLLAEILLRLPALPSSLPRASLVCARWRRLVTDPDFLRRFRAHHWNLLGVFLASFPLEHTDFFSSFFPDPLPVRCEGGGNDYIWEFQGCRHGLVLLFNTTRYNYGLRQVLVWNPVAGEHHLLGTPHFSDTKNWDRYYPFSPSGAVICAAGDEGPGPFKVALAWFWNSSRTAHVCVYSSDTGEWGDVVSAAVQSESCFIVCSRNVLVGNSLYWILFGSQLHILEFDLGTQNLSVIEVALPTDVHANHRGLYLTTGAEHGGLSLIVMSANLRPQLWEMAADSDGVARWVPGRTIELDRLLSLTPGGFPKYRRTR